MSIAESSEYYSRILFTLRLLVITLIIGVAVFVSIVYLAIPTPEAKPGEAEVAPRTSPLSFLVIPIALGCLAGSFAVDRRMAVSARRQILEGNWKEDLPELNDSSIPPPQTEEEYFASMYLTKSIFEALLFAAPAFLAAVVFMASRENWLLALSGLMLVVTLIRFPTRSKLRTWVETQLTKHRTELLRG